MATLHLHHLENSRSFRILWLLEELRVPYELTQYQRVHGLAPTSLKQVHPLGKAPILQDGDKTLIESAVIIEYLIDHYDHNPTTTIAPNDATLKLVNDKQFRPDYAADAYNDYRYWLHFTESSLMPLLLMEVLFGKAKEKSPIGIKQLVGLIKAGLDKAYLKDTLNAQLNLLNDHLANHVWLAGDEFSGADIQLEFAINAMAQTHTLDSKYTHIYNWLTQCQARPAYAQAVAKGGKVKF